jgi:hypothetical protein
VPVPSHMSWYLLCSARYGERWLFVLPLISTKQRISSNQWWSTILPISTKQRISSNQWWSTIPPISTKQRISSNQWWSTIPPISTKQRISSNQWWSTIPPISTAKRTTTSHHISLSTINTTTYDLGQAQHCDGVKRVNGNHFVLYLFIVYYSYLPLRVWLIYFVLYLFIVFIIVISPCAFDYYVVNSCLFLYLRYYSHLPLGVWPKPQISE